MTTMSDECYRLQLRQKFGLRATDRPLPDQCPQCNKVIPDTVQGSWHPTYCKSDVPISMNARHNEVVKLIARTMATVGINCAMEIRPPCSENDRRRIDIKAQPALSSNLFIDVTIRSMKAPSRTGKEAKLHHEAERDKGKKYADLAKGESARVLAFVVDELGKIGPQGNELMTIMWTTAETNGMSKPEVEELRKSFQESVSGIMTNALKTPHQRLSAMAYRQSKKLRDEAESAKLLDEAAQMWENEMPPDQADPQRQQLRSDENGGAARMDWSPTEELKTETTSERKNLPHTSMIASMQASSVLVSQVPSVAGQDITPGHSVKSRGWGLETKQSESSMNANVASNSIISGQLAIPALSTTSSTTFGTEEHHRRATADANNDGTCMDDDDFMAPADSSAQMLGQKGTQPQPQQLVDAPLIMANNKQTPGLLKIVTDSANANAEKSSANSSEASSLPCAWSLGQRGT